MCTAGVGGLGICVGFGFLQRGAGWVGGVTAQQKQKGGGCDNKGGLEKNVT